MNEFTLWAGVLTIISLLLFLCTYVWKTNLWYHKKAAGPGWNALGIIVLVVGLVLMWIVTVRDFPWGYGAAGLALAWLHPVFACGWDFSDIHLPPDKR